MKLYNVTNDYVNYIKSFDSKVPENKDSKRPFVGVIFTIDGNNFFAPLSSPKPKHIKMKNGADFHKITSGHQGVINFNNMIPIPNTELILIDIHSIPDENYKNLLNSQLRFINSNQEVLKKKAEKLYQLVTSDDSILSNHQLQVKKRCIDFSLLLEQCKLYK